MKECGRQVYSCWAYSHHKYAKQTDLDDHVQTCPFVKKAKEDEEKLMRAMAKDKELENYGWGEMETTEWGKQIKFPEKMETVSVPEHTDEKPSWRGKSDWNGGSGGGDRKNFDRNDRFDRGDRGGRGGFRGRDDRGGFRDRDDRGDRGF